MRYLLYISYPSIHHLYQLMLVCRGDITALTPRVDDADCEHVDENGSSRNGPAERVLHDGDVID